MVKVCSNGYKLYLRSRTAASSESIKRMKELECVRLEFHPLLGELSSLLKLYLYILLYCVDLRFHNGGLASLQQSAYQNKIMSLLLWLNCALFSVSRSISIYVTMFIILAPDDATEKARVDILSNMKQFRPKSVSIQSLM